MAGGSPQLGGPVRSLTQTVGDLFILKNTLNLMSRGSREHHCIHYLDVKVHVNPHMNLIRHKGSQVCYELGDSRCSLLVSKQTPWPSLSTVPVAPPVTSLCCEMMLITATKAPGRADPLAPLDGKGEKCLPLPIVGRISTM